MAVLYSWKVNKNCWIEGVSRGSKQMTATQFDWITSSLPDLEFNLA